jgi:filamentous hemagglutinin family protein
MNTRFWYGHCLKIGIVLAATSGYLCSQRAIAQIVPDGTLGAESSIVTPVDIKGVPSDRIDAGAIRGANLFHSFQEFNIRDGRGAYFSNPAGIENIFSRVTGTNASNIFGKLGVLGNANLFLLNPNGIIFGPNAKLDIAGSFSASTGNSFNFGDAKFSATNPTDAPLLAVKVPLGVQFNQNQPSAIANSGNLSVGTGQNLNLMGGTVVSTGQLSAPAGQVAVASVPGGSVVNLSPSAQFLNVETSSPVGSVGSSSLSELLTSVDERSRPGLTVNSNGQVELTGSGLPVVDGDVVARNVTAQTATLTANNNLTLVESQLGTTGDLNLLAGNTVRVRDSVANPFVAQAGGKLLVQGRQGVDIFALNNSSSGLVSGGDLVLRSLNTVGGDAHYWAGGNFRIEQMDGSLGGLFSPYDPIIRASGDVSFQSYTGGSLHILAGGRVTIPGTVTITGADRTTDANGTPNGLFQEGIRLSDGELLNNDGIIDGANSPTLDIRAGVRADAIGTPGIQGNLSIVPLITVTPNINQLVLNSINPLISNNVPTSANIEIGSIVNRQQTGQIFLTNQYQRNDSLTEGSIRITGLTNNSDFVPISIAAFSNPVTIDSRGDVSVAQGVDTSISEGQGGDINILSRGIINVGRSSVGNSLTAGSGSGDGGNITLTADRNITTNGDIRSFVSQGNNGNGGKITLRSINGEIDTRGGTISSKSSDGDATTNRGRAGNVTLTAARDIRSGNIESSSNSNSQNTRDFATINLNSSQGTVVLNRSGLNTTNTGTGFAGDININGREIQIDNSSRIESQGQFGRIFIGTGTVTENLTIRNNSVVSTTNNGNTLAGDIYINGKNIEITNTGRGEKQGIQSQGVNGRVFIGIDNEDNVTANNVTIRNSRVDTQTINGVTSSLTPNKGDGIQIESLGNIEINNSILTAATNSEAPSGSISLNGGGSVNIRNNSTVSIRVNDNATSPQQQINFTPTITLEGSSVNITDSPNSDSTQISASTFNSSRKAGDVIVNARSVRVSGNSKTQSSPTGIFAQAQSGGKIAGNITITTDNLTVENEAEVSVRSLTRNGQAGNLKIFADNVFIKNGGEVSVSAPDGQAGNLTVSAKRISLNNGILRATTGLEINETPGANIFLQGLEDNSPLDFLHLQNESLIAANANHSARGGNITINTRLLLALPPTGRRGSDITANAAQGRGGEVRIRARPLGIYGIEFRPKNTSLNDFTASSQTGPAGIVSIALPDVDPRRGLLQLPEDLGDSSRFIQSSCPVGGKRARSRFVITGRGGLPPNPGSVLNSDILLGESGAIATPPENNSPTPIVEAQGVEIGPKGEIILAANPSQLASSYSPWQRFIRGCYGK